MTKKTQNFPTNNTWQKMLNYSQHRQKLYMQNIGSTTVHVYIGDTADTPEVSKSFTLGTEAFLELGTVYGCIFVRSDNPSNVVYLES